MKLSTSLLIVPIAAIIFMGSCKKETTDTSTSPTSPPTEHHPNDGAVDNGDGTFTITLANKKFTTHSRDFSNVPVETGAKTISATKVEEYPASNPVGRFRVDGNHIMGFLEIDAFTSKLFGYSMPDKKEVSSHNPDSYVVGLDYNGAIMTVEGAENINFYLIENGTVKDHFFQIKNFQGSKFLSECYIDQTVGLVYNTNEVFYFPLSNTSNVKKLPTIINDFSQVRFSSDENYLYLCISSYSDSEIKVLDRNDNYKVVNTHSLPGVRVYGFTVDANYFYVSDDVTAEVRAYNKHTFNYSGSFAVTTPNGLDIVGDMLYVANKDGKTVEKYQVSFN